MLKIQVLGKGLIPRGLGLAPRKEPFMADFTLIATILSTPGLKVNMLHPEDGHAIELTNSNLKRNWDKYANYQKKSVAPTQQQTAPVAPVQTTTAPQITEPQITEPQNAEEKVNDKVEEKVDDKSQQDHTNQNQQNNNQNQGNKNQNGQKNGNNNGFKPVTNDGKNK